MFASQTGRTDVMEVLINHNADVNAMDEVRHPELCKASIFVLLLIDFC